jgi:hypothetical protein
LGEAGLKSILFAGSINFIGNKPERNGRDR